MKKILEVIDSILCWTYFFTVILLLLFRLISQECFLKLLFGDPRGMENEDVSISNIFTSRKS